MVPQARPLQAVPKLLCGADAAGRMGAQRVVELLLVLPATQPAFFHFNIYSMELS